MQVVLPLAMAFAPDMVLVSAGFDAAEGDPLGGMRVSPAGKHCGTPAVVASLLACNGHTPRQAGHVT